MSAGPYAVMAQAYLAAGWSPVPIKPDNKDPSAKGNTGREGVDATAELITEWSRKFPTANIGLRLGVGFVGIDVDQYGDKHGADNLAALERDLGELPPTPYSTSRGPGRSGIRIYRIPAGIEFPGKPCADVEFIQRHHRTVVAAPSIHRTGAVYAWHSDDPALLLNCVPLATDVPWLPDRWVEHFRKDRKAQPSDPIITGSTRNEVSKAVLAVLGEWSLNAAGGRHDAMLAAVTGLVRLKSLDHPGTDDALERVRGDFVSRVTTTGAIRTPEEAEHEFAEALAGARDLVARTSATRPHFQANGLRSPPRTTAPPPNVDPNTGEILAQPDVPGEALAGPDGYRFTDLGNAKRLVSKHRDHLRFVPSWDKWLAYGDGRWQSDHASTIVSHLASGIGVDLLSHIVEVRHDTEKLKALIAHAKRSENASGVAATVKVAQSVPGIAVDHEALDADPWLLNVRNGTVDLRTGHLRPFAPTDLLTMQAAADYLPNARAPLWHAFLERIQPDPEVRGLIQRLAGLALVGQQLEHVLPVGLGEGATGKSTTTKIISTVFGDYAVVASKDLLLALKHDTHPTSKASLFRRRFAHLGELPAGARLDEAQVKELTGGDRITARRMYENEWSFNPSHLLWLHSNHRPQIEGTDDGIWRRVLLIPFAMQIPPAEQDPHLADRIIADESSGVLAWMLDGLADYLEHGLRPPEVVRVATASYRRESDTVAMCMDQTGIAVDAESDISASELMRVHGEWFASAGVGGSEKDHYMRLTAHLVSAGAVKGRSRSKGGHYWKGVGLVDEDAPRLPAPPVPQLSTSPIHVEDFTEGSARVGAVAPTRENADVLDVCRICSLCTVDPSTGVCRNPDCAF